MPDADPVLRDLSDELARALLDAIRNGVDAVDQKTGEIRKVAASASHLNVARQLLKDNGISRKPVEGQTLAELADELRIHPMPPMSNEDLKDEAVA
ncbi:MAG: hypothetical protein WC683_06820 [bacterium]